MSPTQHSEDQISPCSTGPWLAGKPLIGSQGLIRPRIRHQEPPGTSSLLDAKSMAFHQLLSGMGRFHTASVAFPRCSTSRWLLWSRLLLGDSSRLTVLLPQCSESWSIYPNMCHMGLKGHRQKPCDPFRFAELLDILRGPGHLFWGKNHPTAFLQAKSTTDWTRTGLLFFNPRSMSPVSSPFGQHPPRIKGSLLELCLRITREVCNRSRCQVYAHIR